MSRIAIAISAFAARSKSPQATGFDLEKILSLINDNGQTHTKSLMLTEPIRTLQDTCCMQCLQRFPDSLHWPSHFFHENSRSAIWQNAFCLAMRNTTNWQINNPKWSHAKTSARISEATQQRQNATLNWRNQRNNQTSIALQICLCSQMSMQALTSVSKQTIWQSFHKMTHTKEHKFTPTYWRQFENTRTFNDFWK